MSKKWHFIVILTVILTIVITVLYVFDSKFASEEGESFASSTGTDVAGVISHQIDMKTPLPDNPGKILVYKTDPPDVSKDVTLALAKKFNVTGELRGDTVVQSKDLIYGVEILKISGRASYSNAQRPNDTLDAPEKLPTDEEAKTAAIRFLNNNDLFPEGAYFSKASREYATSTDNQGNVTRHNGRVVVGFGRKLNNLDVAGTQLAVEIGGNGDIIRYFANWRHYTPYKEFPIKSSEAAFDELKKNGIASGVENGETVSITRVYLAYATKAAAFREDYLEPVWVFKGKAMAKGSEVRPVTEWIPALLETPREFVTPVPGTSGITPVSTLSTTLTLNTTPLPETGSPVRNNSAVPDETGTPVVTITANESITSSTLTESVILIPTASLNGTPVPTTNNSTTG
jgi:hypothetical protein